MSSISATFTFASESLSSSIFIPTAEIDFLSMISFEQALVTLNNNRFILILILQQNKILHPLSLQLLHLLLRLHHVLHHLRPYCLRFLQFVVLFFQDYFACDVLVLHIRCFNQILKDLRSAVDMAFDVNVEYLLVLWSWSQFLEANGCPLHQFYPLTDQITIFLLHLLYGFLDANHASQ